MKQSLGTENHDQIMKDIDGLSLEKYVDELAGAAIEGIARCKTEKDVWSAVEVCLAFAFPSLVSSQYRLFFSRLYLHYTDASPRRSHPPSCPHCLARYYHPRAQP